MICPYCSKNEDKVIDSRASDGGKVIRRRRQCLSCAKRFTTYERVEQGARLTVVKRDGSRTAFNRDNILKGVLAACGKRPIPSDLKEKLADEVEEEIHKEYEREVPAEKIGRRVMTKLREIDDVAYIRYASEYYEFKNVGDLMQELEILNDHVKDVKDQQRLF